MQEYKENKSHQVPYEKKVWYNLSMSTIEQSRTTEHNATACPLTRTIRLIGDVWTLLIVHNLMRGSRRFGELLDALGNVSPKTVSQRLKMLEEVKLVDRQAYAEIPPRVEYTLTEKGFALVHIIEAMQEFGENYLSDPVTLSPSCSEPLSCSEDAGPL
jgi:DNA-binding HxlR family transcriptional regulator